MKKLFAFPLFLILSSFLVFADDTTANTSPSSDYVIDSQYEGIASTKGKGFSYFTVYQAQDENGKVVGLYALDEKIRMGDTDYCTMFPIWRDIWKNDKIISSKLSKKFIKQIFVLSPIGLYPYVSPGVNVIFDFPRALGNVSVGVNLKYFLTIDNSDMQNYLFLGPNLMWNFYIDWFFDIKSNVSILASFAPLFGTDFNTFRWALNFKVGAMWYIKRNYGITLSYDFMPIFKNNLSSNSQDSNGSTSIIDFALHSLNIGVVFLI